jgi:hypothetical protein
LEAIHVVPQKNEMAANAQYPFWVAVEFENTNTNVHLANGLPLFFNVNLHIASIEMIIFDIH